MNDRQTRQMYFKGVRGLEPPLSRLRAERITNFATHPAKTLPLNPMSTMTYLKKRKARLEPNTTPLQRVYC